MQVSIYGTGYVGLVTGVCLAHWGHEVFCYDVDSQKLNDLQKGVIPIYEKGLEFLLKKAIEKKKIHFIADFSLVSAHGEVQIIAVGTPPCPDGSVDLSAVRSVAQKLAHYRDNYCVIVNKSTVPIGTASEVQALVGQNFDVVSNPEFLKEGEAIDDFLKPDRIIIGSNCSKAVRIMSALYQPLIDQKVPFIVVMPRAAELIKYAANAFLATKISFINEISAIAEHMKVDIKEIQQGVGSDRRIGQAFLNAGCGYGGSCFPKDLAALISLAMQEGYQPSLLAAVQKVNEQQKNVLFKKIRAYFKGHLTGRCIAVWGLAFKPGTDDIRCAPSLNLMESLWKAGAVVQAYDPMAMPRVNQYYADRSKLQLCDSPEAALNAADALVILAEWPLFKNPDFCFIKTALRQGVIFDGRNLYNPKVVARYGLAYYAIGSGMPLVI